jgi:hypothetical protein
VLPSSRNACGYPRFAITTYYVKPPLSCRTAPRPRVGDKVPQEAGFMQKRIFLKSTFLYRKLKPPACLCIHPLIILYGYSNPLPLSSLLRSAGYCRVYLAGTRCSARWNTCTENNGFCRSDTHERDGVCRGWQMRAGCTLNAEKWKIFPHFSHFVSLKYPFR